jgi:hypothetical protein
VTRAKVEKNHAERIGYIDPPPVPEADTAPSLPFQERLGDDRKKDTRLIHCIILQNRCCIGLEKANSTQCC